MNTCLNCKRINIKNKHLVGNKAFNLAFLAKRGIKTANFFVISTSVFEKFARPRSVTFPKILQREILEYADKLKTDRFTVRSSATCEDGENSSFAGQFESYLNVPKNKLLNAVFKCWKSASADLVQAYCAHHKIDHNQVKMAVIIQKMIFADKGGVVFTKNVFQNNDNMVIEAARGLGENIVSGLVNPERIMIQRNKMNYNGRNNILTNGEIKILYENALQIEKMFGRPQDIEWAIESGKIYILQTRPITT